MPIDEKRLAKIERMAAAAQQMEHSAQQEPVYFSAVAIELVAEVRELRELIARRLSHRHACVKCGDCGESPDLAMEAAIGWEPDEC